MPTPLDVVPQHRRYAWPVFFLLSIGFVILSVFLVLEGSEVKGFAPSREPIPDYLPNVTALLPVPTALTPGSDLPSGIQKLHNLTVGCGSYKEYYRQQKAALLSLGALNSSQIDVYFPNITRELVAVAPGHQKPLLPKTGQRPLAADLLNSVAESHITLLEDSLCEVTPRLLQPRDAWLNVSAPVQTLAVDFDVSIALRSIQEARSNHNIVSFVSLDYQGAASEVGLQLEIKLFPDAPRRRQNVVNLEIVDDGYSKYVTLTPSIIRRLDGSEEIIVEATTENKLNIVKRLSDQQNKAAPGTVPAVNVNAPDVTEGILSSIRVDGSTSETSDILNVLAAIGNSTGRGAAESKETSQPGSPSTSDAAVLLPPPTVVYVLILLNPNGISVIKETSLSIIEITSMIMAVASFFSLIFISLFTEQLSQRKMWLAPDELRPKLAAAWAVIVAVAASLRVRCTCLHPPSSGVTNQVGSQLHGIVPTTHVAVP